jgi:peptidoglycan hydrolase-like protein with peptidoglycan-binding domain
MGRSSKKRARVEQDRDGGERLSPLAAAFMVMAAGLTGLITWNAFHGGHGGSTSRLNLAQVPAGATTHVEVNAPITNDPRQTIVIKYDARVEDVQRELMVTGHFKGLVDGVMGPLTEQAIRQYQQDSQLPVTGQVSAQLLEQIRLRKKVAAASDFTGSVSPRAVVAPVAPPPKPAMLKDAGPGIAAVRNVQNRLRALGYLKQPVSGVPDDTTRSAILEFQMDYGLGMDGVINKELLAALKVAEAARQASSSGTQ